MIKFADIFALFAVAGAAVAQAPQAASGSAQTVQAPVKPLVSMKEFMLKVVYPYGDAIFYVEREAPKNEVEWNILETKTLAMAQVANLMKAPGIARDQDQWMKDADLLIDVAMKAYRGAVARNVAAIAALNDEAYESCQSCHVHYRPGYRRRP